MNQNDINPSIIEQLHNEVSYNHSSCRNYPLIPSRSTNQASQGRVESAQLPKTIDSVLNKKEANKRSRLTKASSGMKSSNGFKKQEIKEKEEWSMTGEEEKGAN